MNQKDIIFTIIILIIIYSLNNKNNKNNKNKTKISKRDKENIKTLLRQCARWAAAAEQDKSPIINLLHANYGAGFLWALKDIYTGTEIEQASNINLLEFEKKIINIQDKSTKLVSKSCPEFYKDLDQYLLKIGGDL
jgi:hypothetical protein